jgi:hypothetical protein
MNKFFCLPIFALMASTSQLAVAESITTIPGGEVIDLTYSFDSDTVYWPTADGFELSIDFKGMSDAGFYFGANTLRTAEHGDTRRHDGVRY